MKKVLICYDVPGWAWHRMCLGIQKYAPPEYEVDIVSQSEFGVFNSDKKKLAEYDAISQCSWAESSTAVPFSGKHTTWIAAHGIEYDYPWDGNDYRGRIVTRIRNRRAASGRIIQFDGVLCVSDRLHKKASEMFDNAYRVVPGVDTELFTPIERPENETMTIGWSGQSKGRTKGYDEVLSPLIDSDIGHLVRWNVNNRSAGDCLSRDEMVLWHNSLDLYLSTSYSEGFQMTILEAMSCGVPVIATDCGGASECIQAGVTGSISPEYYNPSSAMTATKHIEETIQSILEDRLVLRGMSDACRLRAEKEFSWEKRSEEWLSAMTK